MEKIKLIHILAWLCKILAILFWLFEATVKIGFDISDLREPSHWSGEDWGTPTYEHRTYLEIAMLIVLALLALLPNRWLVFNPMAFVISLLIALIPFYSIVISITEWGDLLWMTPLAALFTLLPVSLILSFWRQRKGEEVGYV